MAEQDYLRAAEYFLVAERLSDPAAIDRLSYREHASACYLQIGDHSRVLELLTDRHASQEASTHPLVAFQWFFTRAVAETELGLWNAAEVDIEMARNAADSSGMGYCAELRARVAAYRGRYARAVTLLSELAIPQFSTAPLLRDFTADDQTRKIADCMLSIGRALLMVANTEPSIAAAESEFLKARAQYSHLGRGADEARALLGLVRCAARRAAATSARQRSWWRAEARSRLSTVSTVATELGSALLGADVDLLTGHLWLLDALERPPAKRDLVLLCNADEAFDRAATGYGAHPRQLAGCTLSHGNVEVLRGNLQTARCNYRSAQIMFDDVGALDWKARTAIAVGYLDSSEGDHQEALDTILPAILYLDARRFMLPTAAARASYRKVAEDGLELAFGCALELDDANLIVDLIEMAINSGVHNTGISAGNRGHARKSDAVGEVTPPAPVIAGDLEAELDAETDAGVTAATSYRRPPAGRIETSIEDSDLPPSVAHFFDSTLALSLIPPPLLRMPGRDGRIALHLYLAAADDQYEPVRRAGGVLPVV